ncbi:MAG: hypothetical protein ACT4OF_15030 [Caulobacteraceae bacterium]
MLRIPALVVLLIVAALAAFWAANRRVVPLPIPTPAAEFTFYEHPGAPIAGFRDINAAGDIVGYYQETDDPNTAHALLSRADVVSTIDPPSSTRDRRAFGINDAGLVAISYDGRSSYLWDGAAYTPVTYPSADGTVIRGLNNSADLAGEFTDASRVTHAFVRIGGVFTELTFPGAARASARGINDAGTAVGYYEDAGGVRHGFLRNAAGEMTVLEHPGAVSTMAGGINNAGVVVGGWAGADDRMHGFVWREGAFRAIDAPGAQDTLPLGINDAGDIVGEISIGGSYTDYTVPHKAFFTASFRPSPTSSAA